MTYTSDATKADRIEDAGDFPAVVLIDNFNGCNLRCSMCDHKNMTRYRSVRKMKWDLYAKIIEEIARENPGARVWQIFFGDPFLCSDMPGRIRFAKEKGLRDVVLNSNGVLMTPEKSLAVIEAGLDAMYVGIDAATRQTYDRIRVGGDFDKAVRNVLAYRDQLRDKGNGQQKLFVQFVVSDENAGEVEAFKEFWRREGVCVKIRPKISWAGLVDAKNLVPNAALRRKPCYWIMRTVNICADGEVALCSVDLHCRVKCGNVQQHTIKELWQGKLKEYRTLHREGKFEMLPEICRECADWQSAYADYA